jgi:outer membrane protein TolC
MLIGAFDLLLAKQNELEAYQKYLEAIRDYWIFRADLQRSLGGGASLRPRKTKTIFKRIPLPVRQ